MGAHAYRFSLGRAVQLRDELRRQLREGRRPTRRSLALLSPSSSAGDLTILSVPRSALVGEAVGDVCRRLLDAAEERRSRFEAHLALIEDQHRLREAIFAANQSHGVSRAMSERDGLDALISELQEALRQVEEDSLSSIPSDSLTEDFIAKRRADAESGDEGGGGVFKIRVAEPQDLRRRMREARRRRNQLDEEVRRLNAVTDVEVALHPATAEALGLTEPID